MSVGRKILKNLFSLSIAEIANKGIIFITTVYLARVIDADGFGIISFANSIIAIFLLFTTFSLNTIGTREIAKKPENLNKLVNVIVTSRLILFVLAYLILIVLTFFLNKSDTVRIVILLSGFNLLANSLLLDWVYQGIEKMEIQAIRQVVTGVLNLTGILLFVNGREDVILAMIITVSAALINSSWMIIVYFKLFGKIKFELDFSLLKSLLKSALPVTLSNLFINLYTAANIVLLGILKSEIDTGLYSSALKFNLLVMTASSIVQFTFFPVISRAETSIDKEKIMKKYHNLMILLGAILSLSIFTFSDFTILKILGPSYIPANLTLKLMMISTLIMFLNTCYYPPLLAWNRERSALIATGVGGIVNLLACIILIPFYSHEGVAFSSIISELAVLLTLIPIYKRLGGKFHILDIIKIIAIALISCTAGYYISKYIFSEYLSLIIVFVIYLGFVFAFRIVTFTEIKGYFAK